MIKKFRQILSCPEWWLVIIPMIAYRQIAFFHNTMMWDMTNQVFVWHRFISECFHAHILPLWCPYSRLGYPFFADPQSGLFYPPTWLFTYFTHYSLYTNDLEFIAHVIGASFGMRFLLRSFSIHRYTACVFGLVYSLSGPFVSNATHIIFIYSLCWLPFIMGSYVRLLKTGSYHYVLLTAVFLFLQISGGYIGISIILFYVLILLFIYYLLFLFPRGKIDLSRLVSTHILLFSLTVFLSAGFVYAVSLGVPYIDRQSGLSKEMANSIAFTPSSFITLVCPGMANNEFIHFNTDVTMRNIYIGLPVLLLVIVSLFSSRRIKWLIIAGCLFFILAALGSYTPVRGWLYSYIPLMNVFRMASIFRFFSCIGFILLAAYAFDEIFDDSNVKIITALKKILIVCVSVMLIFLVIISFYRHQPLHYPDSFSLMAITDFMRFSGIGNALFFYTGFQLVILSATLLSLYFVRNTSLQKYLFTGVLVLDLCIAVQLNVFSTVASIKHVSDIQSVIDKLPKGFPIVKNSPLISYNEWNDSTLAPPVWHNGGFLRKQVTFDGYNGYNLTAYNKLTDRTDFYKILASQDFINTSPDTTAISIVMFGPNRLTFTCQSNRNVTAHIGQFYFPGWKARMNGSESTKLSADSLELIECSIPRGNHTVEMSFKPTAVGFAFAYTVIVFIISILCTMVLFRRPFIL
jgi:hypothetical protein